QKIGDYYAACMDEAAIEARGASPLGPQLTAIAGIKSVSDMARVVATSHARMLARGSMLFGVAAVQDARDSTETIAAVDQAGLGLPDRDYYLKDDAKSKEIRDRYVDHITRV